MRQPLRIACLTTLAVCVVANCSSTDRDFGDASAGGDPSQGGDAGSPAGPRGGSSADGGDAPSDTAGAAGANATVTELAIVTPSLPGGRLNVPYEVQLLAEGGSGEGYQFELEGELAAGLELTFDGTIVGTPSETGEFAITVTVTDSNDSQTSRDFVLNVTRKRWLAYVSDELTAKQNLLYAVDLANPLLPRTELSPGLAAGEQVDTFTFAPDGSRLAFVVNRGEAKGYLRELYIADLSGVDAKPGVLIATQGGVYWPRARSWALDSSELLFGVETATDSYELFSVGAPDWSAVTKVADGWQADWISQGLALLYSKQGTGYARRGKDGFPAPQILTFSADLKVSNAATERAGFGREVAPCTGQAYFVDFKGGDSAAFETYTSYAFSPTADLIAIGRTSPSRVDLHRLAGYDAAAPLLTLDIPSACSIGWSQDGEWLTFVGADGEPHATHIGPGKPVNYNIEGVTMEGTNAPRSSPDGSWFGLLPRNLFVSSVGKDGPAAAVQVSGKLPNEKSDFIHDFRFAPNSASLYFYGEQEVSDVAGIYWVDLSGSQPAAYKKLYMPALGNIQQADWSADSTTVGYRVAESPNFPSSSPVNLYVSSVLEPAPKARRINRQLYCSAAGASTYCPGVSAFAFQP